MSFFRNLIDMANTSSSKIFLGLVFAGLTLLTVLLKTVLIKDIPMDVLYFCGGLTLSFLGLSSVDRVTGKQTEGV
jgi:hypothetical protein